MFSVKHGWLRYKPHQRFKLPRLIYRYETDGQGFESGKPIQAPFIRKGGTQVMFTRPLYELEWPGTMHVKKDSTDWDDQIPDSILGNIKGFERVKPDDPEGMKTKGYDLHLRSIVQRETLQSIVQGEIPWAPPLPRRIPNSIAYHLAVNQDKYYGPGSMMKHPVAGLPEARVLQVLSASFAIDSSYHAALTYLKWLGETHWQHPLLQNFDTNVREELMGVSEKAIQLYFYLLGDCLYDPDTKWFSRHEVKRFWDKLAGYLWWVGRTGMGLYADHAGMSDAHRVSFFIKWEESLPDVVECMDEWEEGHRMMRSETHVDGMDPARPKHGPKGTATEKLQDHPKPEALKKLKDMNWGTCGPIQAEMLKDLREILRGDPEYAPIQAKDPKAHGAASKEAKTEGATWPKVKYRKENSDTAPFVDGPAIWLNQSKDQEFFYRSNLTDDKKYLPIVKLHMVWPKGPGGTKAKAEREIEAKRKVLQDGLVEKAVQLGWTKVKVTEFDVHTLTWGNNRGCRTAKIHYALAATPQKNNRIEGVSPPV